MSAISYLPDQSAATVHASLHRSLAALAETKEDEIRGNMTPQGAHSVRPPVMIHVHEAAETGRMTVQTASGERELERADAERLRCDATICQPGMLSTATIPPRVRREVLARDQYRCQAPGCGRTRILEVHHIKRRSHGGSNQPENLVTLCSSCHRLWHERGAGSVARPMAPVCLEGAEMVKL